MSTSTNQTGSGWCWSAGCSGDRLFRKATTNNSVAVSDWDTVLADVLPPAIGVTR